MGGFKPKAACSGNRCSCYGVEYSAASVCSRCDVMMCAVLQAGGRAACFLDLLHDRRREGRVVYRR